MNRDRRSRNSWQQVQMAAGCCSQLGRITADNGQGLELPGNQRTNTLMVPQALCDLKSNDKCRQLSCLPWLAMPCPPVALSPRHLVALSPSRLVKCVCQTLVRPKSWRAFEDPFEFVPKAQWHLKLFSRLTLWANTHDKQEPTGPRRWGHLWALWAGRAVPPKVATVARRGLSCVARFKGNWKCVLRMKWKLKQGVAWHMQWVGDI